MPSLFQRPLPKRHQESNRLRAQQGHGVWALHLRRHRDLRGRPAWLQRPLGAGCAGLRRVGLVDINLLRFTRESAREHWWGAPTPAEVGAPHQCSRGTAACYHLVMLTAALLMTSSHSEGVDWVKMDWCNSKPQDPRTTYPKMSKALNATGRPIHFNMCEWGLESPWEWGNDVAQSWRMSGDHTGTRAVEIASLSNR